MIPGVFAAAAASSRLWTFADAATQFWADFGDASTVTTVSGGVSAIGDKSGNGLNLAQSSSGSRPVYSPTGLNGLGVAMFDGAGDQLRRDTASAGLVQSVASVMVFVLRKLNSAPSTNQFSLCIRNGGSGAARLAMEAGRVPGKGIIGGRRLDGDSYQSVSSSGDASTSWQLHCGVFNYQEATLTQYVDCVVDGASNSFQSPGNVQNTAPVGIVIGANPSGAAEYLNGSIAEIAVVSGASADVRHRSEGYLLWRWGLQGHLPAGHPYKSAPPTM